MVDSKKTNHILIVDDTRSDRDLFKYVLSRYGFNVDVSADGQSALEMLSKGDFDLVLCDYMMPNMDGYELLQIIRKDPRFSHVIVIIITSDESDETKVKLLRGGANDFVHKGDSHDEIVARIKVHLDAQAAQAERKVLEVACELADNISQPLSVLIADLDVLKEKFAELPSPSKEEFSAILDTINKQADAMLSISDNLKRLSMDAHTLYKFEKHN